MKPANDPFDLRRFETAQADNYDAALHELQAGQKQTHWMWYVFPQIAGLGTSAMARKYAIASRAEAQAYLAHPMLAVRLSQCAEAMLSVREKTAHQILGSPDDLKLKSSMTLFAACAAEGSVFHRVLDHYYGGQRDEKTLALLSESDRQPIGRG